MPTTFFVNNNSQAAGVTISASHVKDITDDLDTTRCSRSSINAAGSGTVVLTAAQYECVILLLTGVLTGNRTIQVPLTAGAFWYVYNNTTGSYTVTVQGSSGTGITITQTCHALVWADGTNVLRMTPDTEQDGDLAAGTVPALAIEDASLNGRQAAVVADSAVVGGIPVIHAVPVPAGATGDVDVTLTYQTRVAEVWLVKRNAAGGGAGTVQVKNAANAITNAMSIDVADQTVVRCGTIDDAYHTIAAAGTLRVTRTRTASTDETCLVYVLGYRA